MQKERDYIDKAIMEAFKPIEPKDNYNQKLLEKLSKRSMERSKIDMAAFSLILAGFMAIMIYSTSLQFTLTEFKYKVVSEILTVQYNYNLDIAKYLLGV